MSKEKLDASKTNLQVCSILIAVVSLSFKLVDFSQMPILVRVLALLSLIVAMSLLAFAIFFEADATFYYTRGKDDNADYFDKCGYRAMRYGLLFVLSFASYLASSIFPPLFPIEIYMAEILQAILPFAFAFILYMIWRIIKCRKIGKKWYHPL